MSEIKAVLVRLAIRIFPNSRQDAAMTEEVRARKALGIGAGKWVKYLLPDAALRDIREIGGEFRRRNYELTCPWEDGYRLLTVTGQKAYRADAEAASKKFFAAVEDFGLKYRAPYTVAVESPEAEAYIAMMKDLKNPVKLRAGESQIKLPSLVEQSKSMHGETFNPDLYPEWEQMRSHFSFAVEYSPIPKAAHFITDGIAKDTISEMRTDLEARNQERVHAAVKDTYNRLLKPVQDIAQKLADKETIFRDSLITNVREITALIPALNLTNDPALARTAQQIEERFANLDVATLRDDVTIRRDVSKAAKQLVANFGKIGKRRFA